LDAEEDGETLRNHPIEIVQLPNNAKMRAFAEMMQVREPLVNNVMGFMDSIPFATQCTNECIEQNAYYCGYECNIMVNNVLHMAPMERYFCSNQLYWKLGLW
jgi:hypothetical protein